MAPSESLGELVRNANPEGDLLARHALSRLQARLFGRTGDRIQLGRYILEERIGVGGSGVVHRAFDPKHGRKVAVKLLHAGQGPGYEAARARLLREAQSLAKLSHPNVVRIYDVGTYDLEVFDPAPDARFGHRAGPDASPRVPGVYLAMELLEGPDLAQWLAEDEPDWLAIREAFLAAGRGLAAAHALGLIHRDFKPTNVSIDVQGTVRVLDFGLARPLHKDIPDPSMKMTEGAKQRLDELARPFDATLTAPGTLLGTPAYMAPEQHERRPATARSDQYSFCMALYEAWYRHRPFLAHDEDELRALKLAGQVLPPPIDGEVPPHYFEALRRGMSADPEDRFESMEALLEALVAPAPRPALTRRASVLAVGTLAAVALSAGLWTWLVPEPCEAEAWSRHWGPGSRERLARSAASAEPFVTTAARRVSAHLDALAELGDEVGAHSCRAEPRQPQRLACLTAQREHFGALVDTIVAGEPTTLLGALEVLPRWPSPHDCRLGSPGSEQAFTTELGRARLQQVQGQTEAALESAQQALEHAQQLGEAQPMAQAAGLVGHLALEQGQLERARAALTEALWSRADEGVHDPVAWAAIDLLQLARRPGSMPTDAALWDRVAREKAASPETSISLRQRLYLELGRLALVSDDLVRARHDLDQGLALPHEHEDPACRLALQRAAAEAMARDGEHEAAQQVLELATAEAESALGAGHPALRHDTRP